MSQRFDDSVVRQRQLKEHNEYEHAHPEMREQYTDPLEKRVSRLENWRWWIMGGIALIALEIPIVIQFYRK